MHESLTNVGITCRLFGVLPAAKADYDCVPTVVFSHPTIGTVGLTEKAAIAKYGADDIKIYTSTFTNLWYGPWQIEPDDKPKTAMKLVTLLPSERVVGLHCIGEMPFKKNLSSCVFAYENDHTLCDLMTSSP